MKLLFWACNDHSNPILTTDWSGMVPRIGESVIIDDWVWKVIDVQYNPKKNEAALYCQFISTVKNEAALYMQYGD